MFKNTEPQELVIWDAFTRSPIHVVQDYVDLPNQDHAEIDEEKGWRHPTFVAALSPLGDWVAFQQGRYFRLWDTARQRWLDYAKRYDGRPMQAMASSEDGRLLAIAVRRNTIDVIRPFDGQVVASWEIRQLVPMSLAFSANGQRLAIGFVGRLKVYDVVSGDEIAAYHQPARMFHRVAISPNGRVVAASSLSARVWIWDLEAHSELPMLDVGERVRDLAFAADSKRLAVVAEGSMSVWQVGGEKVQNSNPESR